MIEKIASHYDVAKAKIICQYWGATKWDACLRAILAKWDGVETVAWDLAGVTDFMGFLSDIPTGLRLDFVGGLIGLDRNLAESDADYYARLLLYVNDNLSGTAEYIIQQAKSITGSNAATTTYVEENEEKPYRAKAFIATQTERQLTQGEADRIRPAGVRLFVGGFFKLAGSDSVLKTSDGKALLVVGPCETFLVVQNTFILDELTGLKIIDESNENFFIIDEA